MLDAKKGCFLRVKNTGSGPQTIACETTACETIACQKWRAITGLDLRVELVSKSGTGGVERRHIIDAGALLAVSSETSHRPDVALALV